MKQTIAAELTWTGERFERDVKVHVDEAGKIEKQPAEAGAVRALPRTALLPGFVSAHSHAFQRGLRALDKPGNFWSWRDTMYSFVEQLDRDRFYKVSKAAFDEMLAAGITTVGEFHYLHHAPETRDYSFDETVLQAARDAGIRIALLMTYYETGGVGQPLAAAQKRFETKGLDEFWKQVDAVASKLDARTQSLGIAAHSIRSVPLDRLIPLYNEARHRNLQFHMHVEEQRKEIDDCVNAYARTPMQLINDRLESCHGFVAVHATHTDPVDMKKFMDRGGSVCITPLTEAYLGDGIPHVSQIRPDRLSLGSDSNARISMIEEMRWLEYAQRLKTQTRGVFRGSGRDLVRFATTNGARALGLRTGQNEPGAWADFVTINLDAPSIAGAGDDKLLDAIAFGAGNGVISGTCVAGVWKS